MWASLRLLFLLLSILPLLLLEAEVLADDWSISRPADPAPRTGSSSGSSRGPRAPQLSRAERLLNEALADPLTELFIEELIAIERAEHGSLERLRGELEKRGTPRARLLLALIEYREGAQAAAEEALRKLRDEGERLASIALARIARERGEAAAERAHLLDAINASPTGRERDELRETLAAQALAHGELKAASAQIDILLKERPRDLGLRERWASEYSRAGAHREALRLIDSAIALRRGDLRALIPLRIERARILRASDANAEALEEIAAILRLGGSAPYRMSLYELELEAHRALGSLELLGERLAGRSDIEASIVAAQLFEELGRDEDAAAAYERALRRRSGDRDLRGAYARLLSRMGRIDDVLREYERLVRETRGDAHYTRELSLLYERLGRRDDAIALLDRMVRLQPRSVSLARAEVELRERFGDEDGMRIALARWKRLAPNDPEPRVILASSYLAEGRERGEERAVAELSSLMPPGARQLRSASDRATGLELARIYLELDLTRHAEELLREILARMPQVDARPDQKAGDTSTRTSADERAEEQLIEARLLLAEALVRPRAKEPATINQRRAEAISIYETLLEEARAPRERLHEVRRLLARLLHDARRLDQAIVLLEGRLEREPEHEPTRLLLIEAYMTRSEADLPKAVALLEGPAAQDAEKHRDSRTIKRLIEIRRREGAREEEMALLKELIALEPSESAANIDRLIELATLLYLDEEALDYAEMATRRSPSDPAAFRRLGAFYLDRSRLDEAAQAYRRALALDEFDLETLEALGRIALRMNAREEARDYALRVLRLSSDDEQIRRAGFSALRLSIGAKQLEELERLLVSLTSGLGEKRAYRSLLLPMYEALAQIPAHQIDRVALGRRALAFLVEQLFGEDASATRRALGLLAALRPNGAEAAILRFANSDASASLRAEALLTYGRIGGKLSKADAARLLLAEPPALRRAAAWVIHLGGDEARRALLDSPDLEIQSLGALSYFHKPDRAMRAALLQAFNRGPSVELRAASALALSRYDEAELRARIALRALASPPLERAASIYALQGSKESEPLLALALARLDPDSALRALADHALRGELSVPMELGDGPDIRRIIDAIVEPSAAMNGPRSVDSFYLEPSIIEAFREAARLALRAPRTRALAAMRELLRTAGDPAALPSPLAASIVDGLSEEFQMLLERDDAEIRGRAAELITRASSDEKSSALVRDLMKRDDEETLRRALLSIRHAPSGELLALLQEIIESELAWPARQAALKQLSLADSAELGGFFEKIARYDTHSIVRAEAVSALSKIPSSRARLRDLSETHPDPWIRAQAKNAIDGSID